MAQTARKFAVGAVAALLNLTILSAPLTASSADYPRRIAVAPFVNLTGQDEIKPVVAVLPRLLATRLMALAGAEAVLLPPGEKSSEEAAKEAAAPLVLQGTVSKLGKGYSIDTTVTDLSSGKAAGAFFASAATEDEIIPQLGVLAADMAEKLFGVKSARPQPVPAPGALPAVAPPAAAGASPATVVPVPAAVPAGGPVSGPRAEKPPAPAAAPAAPWEPAKIVKVGMSDRIPDTIFRVSAGDVDGDGVPEVAAIGSRRLFVYKVVNDNVISFRKLEQGVSHLFLNVEAADIDGDGRCEIVVTDLKAGNLETFAMALRGDSFESAASGIPYFVASLDDGKGGRRLVGQKMGIEGPFGGKVVYLRWDPKEKTLVPDGDVPAKVSEGPFGLAQFPGDPENRVLYVDADEHIRLVDGKGRTHHKTKEYYSGAVHMFTWGQGNRSTVGPDRHYVRGRIFPVVREGQAPVFVVRQAKGNTILKEIRSFDWSRLVLLAWSGDGFSERGASERIDNLMTDFAVVGASSGPGLRLAVPVIDWSVSPLSPLSATGGTTRLHIYSVE